MIGAIVWIFNENHRSGRRRAAESIQYEYWRPHVIIGENRLNWITDQDEKVPKNPDRRQPDRVCMTEAEVKQRDWVRQNRSGIASAINLLDDDQLIRVAEVIGYTPLPGAKEGGSDA